MEQDIDSRPDTLERKRPHNVISRDDASNAGSAHSTPRKRAKQTGKLGHQDVRDFVPVGGSFSTTAVPMDEAQENGDEASQVELSPKAAESYRGNQAVKEGNDIEEENTLREIPATPSPHDVQTAPPVTWNAVNTTKIRTTLGGSAGKFKALVDEQILANGAQKKAEDDRDTGRFILPQLLEIYSCKSTKFYLFAATSVALARVEGLRVRLSAMDPHDGPVSAYKTVEEELHNAEVDYNYCLYFPIDEEFHPPPVSAARNLKPKESNSRERRVRLWEMIEQRMKDGTLQDPNKERKIRVGSDSGWGQKSASERYEGLDPPGGQIDRETGYYAKPQDGGGPNEAGKGDSSAAVSANVKPTPTEEAKHRNIEQESSVMSQSDDDLYVSDSGAASNSDNESNDSDMDSEGQSEDGDAMMQYSNSEQLAADEAERTKKTLTVPAIHRARILADLSSHDFNAQLRYFHITKAREEVDQNTPVRCLVCAKEGHMAGLCEFLTCSTCGAFNQHMAQACPENAKCGKCREQGHDEGHCPYKLKMMPGHEIICDLCQRNGHIEEDCELLWRTSGWPWESNSANANVRLSCYECGRSGHLGNDCPSRKPNKSMGTSTWHGSMGLVSIKSTREIKIKGKATQQDPIDLDDSDDDRANFFRPKVSVPKPVRKGQIQIVTGRRGSPVHEPTRIDRQMYADYRHDSFTPVNEYYRNDGRRPSYEQYQDGGRGNSRAGDEPDYATGRNDLRSNNYRPIERRSRSPPYRNHGGYAGGSSWVPPRPADRRPSADANVYRPMPSAAQNAWTRRRV